MKLLIVILLAAVVLPFGCSTNLDYVKDRSVERWKEVGFEVVGYEGFQWGIGIPFTPYGNACVWHNLRRIPDNGVNYSGYLKRWGNEIQVYGPNALDAIRPNN